MSQTSRSRIKQSLRQEISRRQRELYRLCSDLVRIPSENPPGNTHEVASFIIEYLKDRGVKYRSYEPIRNAPNIVARIEGASRKPNFVFNGHMDILPAYEKSWRFAPFCGKITQTRILGRGAADMKAGLAADLMVMGLLHEIDHRELPGSVTATFVSDEETGGKWGTLWLLKNVPEIRGDACLIGEPGAAPLRLGEKGVLWARLRCTGIPSHGAYPTTGCNAVDEVREVLSTLRGLITFRGRMPRALQRTIREGKKFLQERYGKPTADLVDHVSLNVGMISGGKKINLVPFECEAEIDIRLPFGVKVQAVRRALNLAIKRRSTKGASWEILLETPASYTSTNQKIVRLVHRNAEEIGDQSPLLIGLGMTDARFYRSYHVPAVIYGPYSNNMGRENEYVTKKELLNITLVHAGVAADFFEI